MSDLEIEVSAKTVEDAVLEAAIKFGTTRDKISYDIISRGTSGFLGIGGKKAVIKARVKSEEEIEASIKTEKEMEKIHNKIYSSESESDGQEVKKPEIAKPENNEEDNADRKHYEKRSNEKKSPEKQYAEKKAPERKSEEKKQEEKKKTDKKTSEKKVSDRKQPDKKTYEKDFSNKPYSEKKSDEKKISDRKPVEKPEEKKENEQVSYEKVDTAKVEKFLLDIFAAMDMKVGVNIVQKPKDREIDIDLSGDDMAVLIGKRGQTLDSLQYLASLVVNKDSDVYIRVKVDIENYRERRKATLENLARNMAQKARRTGKAVSLEPMNPYERRVIHSALQNDRFVTTHSEGEDPYRHVVITLKEGVKPEGNYNRNRNRNRRGGGYNKKRER